MEFKVSRIREALVYQGSRDSTVASAGIEVWMGRKWRAKEGLDMAECRQRYRVLVGTVAGGKQGWDMQQGQVSSGPAGGASRHRGGEDQQDGKPALAAGVDKVGRSTGEETDLE